MIFSRHILSARKNILLVLSELTDLYRFSYTIDVQDILKYLKCSLYDLKYNLGKYIESSAIAAYDKGIVIKCCMYL